MKTPNFDVAHLAHLARLNLTEGEVERFEADLERILAYVDQLQEVDTEGLEETAQVTGLVNVLRDDHLRDDHEQMSDKLLAAAPDVQEHMVKVPMIIDQTG